MKTLASSSKILTIFFALALLAGCATGPSAPYYSVKETPPSQYGGGGDVGYLTVGPQDQFYILHVEDRTPFGLHNLPKSMNTMYEKGYDQARRQREADFSLDVSLFAEARDNPDRRAGHVVGGALLGAATGAIIGAAVGDPGAGAAIGAGSGAALGLVSPADTPMVRIDIRVQSFRDGGSSYKSAMVDLANVPPHDVHHVIDLQVSRMLQTLPAR
ncbi:MAG: glycine zipper family protein [Syntrophobacteraceae bacterium]